MIKEGIDKVLSLAGIQSIEIGTDTYVKGNQNVTRLVRPEEKPPDFLHFSTLTGFADYIESNPDRLDPKSMIIHVADFDHVELLGPLQPTNDQSRFMYAKARSTRRPFAFGQWMKMEDFIIALQSDFYRPEDVPDDSEAIIDLLGKVASETIKTNEDDGFSQTIQIRSGLTTKENVTVENPVRVHPWRTFGELSQPRTLAVLRFRQIGDGVPSVALFESGGESWRLEAIEAIQDWLRIRFNDIHVLA